MQLKLYTIRILGGYMKKQGISLITLVIIIVIIIILAGSVILNLSGNNPIKSSTKAKIFSDIDSFSSELTISISKGYTKENDMYDVKNINLLNEEEIIKYIPSIKNKKVGSTLYTDILVVSGGKLAIDVTKANEAVSNSKLSNEQYSWALEAVGDNVFNAQTYVIKYYKNDGTEEYIESSKIHDVKYIILSNTSKREGYGFKNWNTEADGTGITYNVGDEYVDNAELTLYAQWEVGGISALDVKNDPSTYYGEYVEYTPKNGCDVKWRIFYADDTQIYLIAEDYIPNSYLEDTGLTKSTDTTNNLKDYCVYSSVNRQDLVDRLSNTAYYEDFKDTAGKATSVVGAPTLEQFIKSYNGKNNDKIEVHYYAEANEEYGGYISIAEGYGLKFASETSYNCYVNIPSSANKYDLYVRASEDKAYGIWLGSFSLANSDHVMIVNHESDVGFNYYDSPSIGLRPVVCLDSKVKLVDKNGDGILEIE